VTFTSSDESATLPGDYTFTAGDGGAHTFAGGVTLFLIGNQSITATDTSNQTITGSANVTVTSGGGAAFPGSVRPGDLQTSTPSKAGLRHRQAIEAFFAETGAEDHRFALSKFQDVV
jgi:hypothetical protein